MAKGTTKKSLNLATAKVADGALAAPRSVYELVGIPTTSYRSVSRADYEKQLDQMDLVQLQDEAYKHAVPATSNRNTIKDRLLGKFINETSRFSVAMGQTYAEPKVDPSLREQAAKIASRGR